MLHTMRAALGLLLAIAATQTIGSLSIAAGATLDLGANDLVVNYSSVSTVGVWAERGVDVQV